MRRQREILEYTLKNDMALKSINVILPYLIDKEIKMKKSPLLSYIKVLINKSQSYCNDRIINYKLAFLFNLVLGEEYYKILSNEELLKSTIAEMKNERNWDESNISFEVSIFFTYTLFNEIYKDISVDIFLLTKEKNPKIFIDKILKEPNK